MNDTTPNDAPVPFPDKEERDALILEFQRLAARLTRAGLMSRASSSRLMRSMNQERRYAEDKRHAFPELVLAILLAIEDGRRMARTSSGKACRLSSACRRSWLIKRMGVGHEDVRESSPARVSPTARR